MGLRGSREARAGNAEYYSIRVNPAPRSPDSLSRVRPAPTPAREAWGKACTGRGGEGQEGHPVRGVPLLPFAGQQVTVSFHVPMPLASWYM